MKGVRRDRWGLRVYVSVGDIQREKRFPFDTATKVITAWREATRVDLRALQGVSVPQGALQRDIQDRYLPQVKAMATYAQRKAHLELWAKALGAHRPRGTITAGEIRVVLQAWREGGLSAGACNKRRAALMHLWTTLDGKGARNPVRDVRKFPEPHALPRGRDPHVIDKRLLATVESRMRASCRVLLWTGMRPAELDRAEPDDIDWRQATIAVRTAKGGRMRVIPLTPQAVAAWKEFDRVKAWHRVPTAAPMNRWLKKVTGMPTLRVYDLRHSFGTALALRQTRLDVIGALMGHSTLELTKRYTAAAIPVDAEGAMRRLRRKGVSE